MRRRSSGKETHAANTREKVVGVGVKLDYTNVALDHCQTLVVNGVMRHAEVRTERVVVTGRFHGSVEASLLEVTKGAMFVGRAVVREATVAGRLEGILVASEMLNLRSSGQCQGVLRYGQLNVQHGGKLAGSVKATSAVDAGIGDIAVPDLPDGTWDDVRRGRGSSKGPGPRILRPTGQPKISMGSDANILRRPSAEGGSSGGAAGTRRNRSSAPPPSTSARAILAATAPLPSASTTVGRDIFVASKARGASGIAHGAPGVDGVGVAGGGGSVGGGGKGSPSKGGKAGRYGLAVAVGGTLCRNGGDGSVGSVGSSGWGALREPPAVSGASPDASEIDMLEFLQEAGERRLREEAAEEHPTDATTSPGKPTSCADFSPLTGDPDERGMEEFLRDFLVGGDSGAPGQARLLEAARRPPSSAAPSPAWSNEGSGKAGSATAFSVRHSAEGTDDMSAVDDSTVDEEWFVATRKAVAAPTAPTSATAESVASDGGRRENSREQLRLSPKLSPRLSSGQRTPVRLTSEGERLQKLLFPKALLADSNAKAAQHRRQRYVSPSATTQAAALAPSSTGVGFAGKAQAGKNCLNGSSPRLNATAPASLYQPASQAGGDVSRVDKPLVTGNGCAASDTGSGGTPGSTEGSQTPRRPTRTGTAPGRDRGGSTDQSREEREERDRAIEEQRMKLRKASQERMLKRRAEEEVRAMAAARLTPRGLRHSEGEGGDEDSRSTGATVGGDGRRSSDSVFNHKEPAVAPGSARLTTIHSPAYGAPQISSSPPSGSLSSPGLAGEDSEEMGQCKQGGEGCTQQGARAGGTREWAGSASATRRVVFSSIRAECGGSPVGDAVSTARSNKFPAPSPAGGDVGSEGQEEDDGERSVPTETGGVRGEIFIEGMVTPASSWEYVNTTPLVEAEPLPPSTTSSAGRNSKGVSPPSPAGGDHAERSMVLLAGGPSPAGMNPDGGGGDLNFSMHGILKTPKISMAEAESALSAAANRAAGETGARSEGFGGAASEGAESERIITRVRSTVLTPPSALSSTGSNETPATSSARSPPAGPSAAQAQRRLQARVREGKLGPRVTLPDRTVVPSGESGGHDEHVDASTVVDRSRLQRVLRPSSRPAGQSTGSSRSAGGTVRGEGPKAWSNASYTTAEAAARGASEAAKRAMKAALEVERKAKGLLDWSQYGDLPVVQLNPSSDSLAPMSPLMPRLPAKQALIGGRDVAGTRPSSARSARGGESTGNAPVSPIVKPRPLSAHAASCRRDSSFAETSPERSGFVRCERKKGERDSGEEVDAQTACLVGASAEPLQPSRESSAPFSVDVSTKSEVGAAAGSAPLAAAVTVVGSTATPAATKTLPGGSSPRQSAAEEPTSLKLATGESHVPEAEAGSDGGDGSDNISSGSECEGDKLDGVGPTESGTGAREGGCGDVVVAVDSGDDATAEAGESYGYVSSADSPPPTMSALGSHLPTIASSRQTAFPVSPSRPPRPLPVGVTISSAKGITGDVRGAVDTDRQGSFASQEGDGADGAAFKQAAARKDFAALDAANSRALTIAKAAEDAARRAEVLQRAVETAAATAEGSAQTGALSSRVEVADEVPCAAAVKKSVSIEPILTPDVPPASTEARATSIDKSASAGQDGAADDAAVTLHLEAVVEQIPNEGADTDASTAPDTVPAADLEAIVNQEGPITNADARVTEITAASRSAQVSVADEAQSSATLVDEVSAGERPNVVGNMSPGVSRDGKIATARTMPLLATDGGGDSGGGSGDPRVDTATAEESLNSRPSSSVDMQRQNSETDTEVAVVELPDSTAEAPPNLPPHSTEPVSCSPAIAVALPKATTKEITLPNAEEPAESPIPTATTASEETSEPSDVSAKQKVDATTASPSTAPVNDKFGLLSHGMGGGAPTLTTRSALLRRPLSGIAGHTGGPGARVGLSSRASGTTAGLTVNTDFPNRLGEGQSMPRVGSDNTMVGGLGARNIRGLVAGQAARDRSPFVSPDEVKEGLGPAGAFAGNSNWRVEMSRQKSTGLAAAKADGHGGFHNPMAALRATQMLERGGGGARGIGSSPAGSGDRKSMTPSPATSLDGGKLAASATSSPFRLPFQDPASMTAAGAVGRTSPTPIAIPAWMMAKGRASALRSPTGVLGRRQGRPGQPQLRSPTSSSPRHVLQTPPSWFSPQRDSLTNTSIAPSSVEVSSGVDVPVATSDPSGSVSSRDEARQGSDSSGESEKSAAVNVSGKGRETLPIGNNGVAGEAVGVDGVWSALPLTANAPREGDEDITCELDAKDPIDDRRASPTAVSEKLDTAAAAAIEQPAANSDEASEESPAVDIAVGMAESVDTPAESTIAKDSREDIPGESKDNIAASGVENLPESEVSRVAVPALTEGMSAEVGACEEDGLQEDLGDAPTEETAPRKTPSPGALAALGRFLFAGPSPPPARFALSGQPAPATVSASPDVVAEKLGSCRTAVATSTGQDEEFATPETAVVVSSDEDGCEHDFARPRGRNHLVMTSGGGDAGVGATGFGAVDVLETRTLPRASWRRSPLPRNSLSTFGNGSPIENSSASIEALDGSGSSVPSTSAPVTFDAARSTITVNMKPPTTAAEELDDGRSEDDVSVAVAGDDLAEYTGESVTNDGPSVGRPHGDGLEVNSSVLEGSHGAEATESTTPSDDGIAAVVASEDGEVEAFSAGDEEGEVVVDEETKQRQRPRLLASDSVDDVDASTEEEQRQKPLRPSDNGLTPSTDSVTTTNYGVASVNDSATLTPSSASDYSLPVATTTAGGETTEEHAVVVEDIDPSTVYDDDSENDDEDDHPERAETTGSDTSPRPSNNNASNNRKDRVRAVKSLTVSVASGTRSSSRRSIDGSRRSSGMVLSKSKSPSKPTARKSRPVMVRATSLLSGERKTGLAALEEEGTAYKAARRALVEESKQRRAAEIRNRPGIFETLRQRSAGNLDASRESSRRGLSSTMGSIGRRRDSKDVSPPSLRKPVSAKPSAVSSSGTLPLRGTARGVERRNGGRGVSRPAGSEAGGDVRDTPGGESVHAVDAEVEPKEDSDEDSEEEPDYWAEYGIIDDAALDDTAEIEI